MITRNHPTAGVKGFPDGTSEDEIAVAMRKLDAQQPQKTPAAAPTPAPAQTQAPWYNRIGPELDSIGPALSQQYGQPISKIASGLLNFRGSDLSQGTADLTKSLAPSVRLAGYFASLNPEVAAMNYGSRAVITGLAAISADMFANQLEGQKSTLGRELQVGLLGSSGSQAMALLGPVESSALARTFGYGVGAGVNAGIQYGVSTAGETIKSLLDTGRMPSGQELSEARNLPTMIAAGLGAFSRYGEGVRTLSRETAAAKQVFGDIPPPLGYQSPTMFGQGSVVGRTGRNQTQEFESVLAQKWNTVAMPQVDGATMAAELRPFANSLDDARIAQASLSKANLEAERLSSEAFAELQAARAQANAGISVDIAAAEKKLQDASDAVTNVNAVTIAKNAESLLRLKMTDRSLQPAQSAALFRTKIWEPMQLYIKKTEDALFSGIDTQTRRFDGQGIRTSITSGKAFRESAEIDQIKLNATIDRYIVGDKGVIKDLNLADIRALRRELNEQISPKVPGAGIGSTRILSEADDKISSFVTSKMSPAQIKEFKRANRYYRTVLDAEGDSAIKLLAAVDPSDFNVQTFVNNMVTAGGDSTGYLRLMKYIDTVAAGNAQLGITMKSHAADMIRGALLNKNLEKASDLVNLDGLYSDLLSLSKGRTGVLKVRDLGLGSLEQVRDITQMVKKAGLGNNLNAEEFNKIFNNAYVANILDNPKVGRLTVAVDQVANEIKAVKELQGSRDLQVIGLTKRQDEAWNRASGRARLARKDLREIDAQVETLENTPLAKAMSGNKNFGINSTEGGDQFKRFVKSIADPSQYNDGVVREMLTAIEGKSPEFLQQVRLHVIADTLDFVTHATKNTKESVNWDNVAKFFGESNKDSANRIKMIVGPEAWKDINAMSQRLEIVRQRNMLSQEAKAATGLVAEGAVAGKAIITANPSSFGIGTLVKGLGDIVARGHYKAASVILGVPGIRKAMDAGANLEEAISKLGLQQSIMLYQNTPGLREDVDALRDARFQKRQKPVEVPASAAVRRTLGGK